MENTGTGDVIVIILGKHIHYNLHRLRRKEKPSRGRMELPKLDVRLKGKQSDRQQYTTLKDASI